MTVITYECGCTVEIRYHVSGENAEDAGGSIYDAPYVNSITTERKICFEHDQLAQCELLESEKTFCEARMRMLTQKMTNKKT